MSRISDRFRKSRKKSKAHWPTESQLRVLKLIKSGYSPKALSEKLNIPVQTYYHWRRMWKNAPKKNLNFIEVPVSDKLKDPLTAKNEEELPQLSSVIVFPNGVRVENVNAEIILRLIRAV